MRLYQAKDRKALYTRIWIYKERREKLRSLYKWKNGQQAPENYKHAVFNINEKIKHWKKMITKIDENNTKITAISNAIIYHFGTDLKQSIHNTHPRWKQAKHVFFKYCLEHKISATLVAEFVGASRGDVIARDRKTFTKTFENTPKNREIYNGFCEYVKIITAEAV
jgi:hypothetical protein